MDKFVIKDGVLQGYFGEEENVVIPSEVVEIGYGVFSKNRTIKSVVMGENVKVVGGSAFESCTCLESVSFSQKVEKICYRAFYRCSALKRIVMPDSLREIESAAFGCCFYLSKITFSKGMNTIEEDLLTNCFSLQELKLPANIEVMDCTAVDYTRELKKIIAPGLTSLKGANPKVDMKSVVPIFAPNFDPNSVKGNARRSLLIGYCFNRDKYDSAMAIKYEKLLKSQRRYLEEFAKDNKLLDVIDYYAALDDGKPEVKEESTDIEQKIKDVKKKTAKYKVDLLEEVVLGGTVEELELVIKELKPFEFSARALGLACRFAGFEKVDILLKNKVVFEFTDTPSLRSKYGCYVKVSNSISYPIQYWRYLFPAEEVKGYSESFISDDERECIAKVLVQKKLIPMEQLVYATLCYHDDVIYRVLQEENMCKLALHYATHCSIPNQIRGVSDGELRTFFERVLECTGNEQITLSMSELSDKEHYRQTNSYILDQRFCSGELFEFMMKHTNMAELMKKTQMVYGLVDKQNASGLAYALKEEWISGKKTLEKLLSYAQEKPDCSGEVKACILEVLGEPAPSKDFLSEFNLKEVNPLSATELKKKWSTKKLDDGTLMITSYKGTEKHVVVPDKIGKLPVTVIGEDAFYSYASGCPNSDWRETGIVSVTIPKGIKKIQKSAFYGCRGLKTVDIPKSCKIGEGAFGGCKGLANEEGVVIVNNRLFDCYRTNKMSVRLPNSIKGRDVSNMAHLFPPIAYRELEENAISCKITNVKKGETVEFGRLSQTKDFLMQPIKWKVLACTEEKVLLVSEKCLFPLTMMKITATHERVRRLRQFDKWSECELREFLNCDFIQTAFTEEERENIIEANLKSEQIFMEQKFSDNTQDKVFLLSKEEVENYMPLEERKSDFTEYAIRMSEREEWIRQSWVLRSPVTFFSRSNYQDAEVAEDGAILTDGLYGICGVRPAMWVRI